MPLTDQLSMHRMQWLSGTHFQAFHDDCWNHKEQKLRQVPARAQQDSKSILTSSRITTWPVSCWWSAARDRMMQASIWPPDYLHWVTSGPKYDEKFFNLISGSSEGKCDTSQGQDLKPVDLVFQIRRDSNWHYLMQRSYCGDKWSEMKVQTITYLEVNWR